MRLPLLDKMDADSIDVEQVKRMEDAFMNKGFTYFDTAWMYCGFNSESIVKTVLVDRHPRDSYTLATKLHAGFFNSFEDRDKIFEQQMQKTGVTYFDYYLLHNVYENSFTTYTNPRWGIVDYFVKQKEMGRIRHLGFSCHGLQDTLVSFLDKYGGVMEFGQIQLNYLDWTLQDAKAKYDLLTERGIAVWVMEPVRGGRLAKLNETDEVRLHAVHPEESTASWAFRWLQGLPNVKCTSQQKLDT